MFFQDAYATSPTPDMPDDAGSGQKKSKPLRQTGLQRGAKQAPDFFGCSDVDPSNDRPFHTRPSFPNRRARPRQKWLVVAGFFIVAALGYLAGVRRNQQSLHSARPAPSSSTTSETQLVVLQGGSYSMGDTMDGLKDTRPHPVSLAPFMIARHEVTLELWDDVMLWGRDHGYPDLPTGSGKAHNHPVYGISWGDAVKWCNALSEKEGLTPCYYSGTTRQNVARKGMADIGNRHVNWEASGYRLPTEAEWEFAARSGQKGKRFPWGNEITHVQANYHGSLLIPYDKCRRNGPEAALMSSTPCTVAIGSFPPNGFGLHDMAGNVAEWCWDFYDKNYGAQMPLMNNPHGPDCGTNCVVRGGSWRHTAADARCASRFSLPGDQTASYVGFRVVRSL